MKLISKILIVIACLYISVSFAQRGKEGSVTINANRIVNEYTSLTADAFTGNTSISVTASSLNPNSRFSGPLSAGDLIMIIQMQGVTVNGDTIQSGGTIYGTPVDNTWGEIWNYNSCGNYEFCEVKAVPDAVTITLDCALQHDYSNSGRVQVIRVPRYASLTITSPGTITCPAWVTTSATRGTGGIVAIEVLGNTTINNANGITVSSLGFRGGSTAGDNSSGTGGGQVARSDKSEGAEKGEGVFGYQADYDKIGGRYCRGVAGNAGGGANMHNSAGGGGANAGDINAWDGEGNPDASVAGWITAWNREAIPNFATHTSSGGGRGGYSFAAFDRNATVEGPRPFGSGATNNWGGDFRTNNGGWGGRPLDYSTGRLFIGGGGGAGDQDNNQAGGGGKGAGLIYLMSYGTVSGTGSVTANGAAGVDAGIDGAGGGGGGGTVIINSVGTISGISISANGGAGGNQVIPAFTTVQSEGPGGGGGGGYIAISNGTITQTVAGGANGTTDASHLSEFLPNGATKGGSGLSNQSITNFTIAASNVSICSGNTANLSAALSGTVPSGVTITWWDAQIGGNVVGSSANFTTPVLTRDTTYYVGTCPGTYRIAVVITVTAGSTIAVAGNPQTLCGTTASLTGNTPSAGTGTWSLISGAGTITTPSSPTSGITGLGAGPNVFEWSISMAGCSSSTSQVTITGVTPPTISVAGSPQTICGTTTTLAGNNPASGSGLWTLVSGSGTITSPSSPTSGITALGAGANVFQWTISNSPCTSSSSQVTINVSIPPTTSAAGGPQTVCGTTATLGGNPPATGTGLWTLISGTGTITTPSYATSGITALGAGANVFEWSITNGTCPASTSQVTITGVTPPTTSVAGGNQTICGTTTTTLSGNTPTAGSGLWTLVSGSGLITSPSSPTSGVTGLGAGSNIFEWTISNAPCPSSSTQVTITSSSSADATITQPSPVCLNASPFILSAATSGGTWSGTGITNSSTGMFDPSLAGIGTDTITYAITGSCNSIDTVVITINASSNSTISQPATICIGTAPFDLTAATTGGTWSGTGITNSVNGTFDPSVAGIGIDTIRYTISGTCGSFDTVLVKVNPPADATINNVLPVCKADPAFNLTAATSGGTWTGPGITNSVLGTFDPSVGAGTFSVTYTISGACGNSDIQTVTVNATPSPGISAATTIGCAPLCIRFTETSGTICNTLNYQFGDGNTSFTSSPLHCYNQAGIYSVAITCNNNGCSGTTTINNMITVLPTPVANFSVSPSGIVGTNTIVTVNDVSTSGGNQAWDFGDPSSTNNTSALSSDSHSYATEGNFCIQLISTNTSGCADTTSNCIIVANDATLVIPNVFTPNGDGTNDVFNITSSGVKTLSLNIYDRWGVKIIELNSVNEGWDGRTASGNVSSDGVYYYIIKATSVNDKNIEKEGFVQLLGKNK